MIRVNLLPTTPELEQVPIQVYAGVAVVLVGALGLGLWYWSLNTEAAQLQETVSQLEQESQRLQAILNQIQEYEGRKESLQERIAVIENLQASQKGPVQLMNVVIAAVPADPPGLWLSNLTQRDENITIEGRAFEVPYIADFIASLNESPLFRFVELQFWEQDQPNSIRFQLNCQLAPQTPEEPTQ